MLNDILLNVVDTAVSIAGADFGTVQLYEPASNRLRIAAQHGLPEYWLNYWNEAGEGEGTCGTALATQGRIIVEDVLTSPIFADSDRRAIMFRAGIRSVQSTPIVNRSGIILGMMSTHRKTPSYPSPQVLRTLDLFSRLAADAIELPQLKTSYRRLEAQFNELRLQAAIV